MNYIKNIKTPIGLISVVSDGENIIKVEFGALTETQSHHLLIKAEQEILEYFTGKRKDFELPLSPSGTEFQKRVWKNLLKIPYGKTVSYAELAQMSGNKKACRAVGGANNKNPISILIPCHRCIGSDGRLVGYGGGLNIKQFLLELEKDYTVL